MDTLELRSWKDLEQFGFYALTGEACNMGQRMLVDMTDEAANHFRLALGLPCDCPLRENRNYQFGVIASAMIPHDLVPVLSMICLLSRGYKIAVLTAYGSVIGFKQWSWNADNEVDDFIDRYRIRAVTDSQRVRFIDRVLFDMRPRTIKVEAESNLTVYDVADAKMLKPYQEDFVGEIEKAAKVAAIKHDIEESSKIVDGPEYAEKLEEIINQDYINEWWGKLKAGDKFLVKKDWGKLKHQIIEYTLEIESYMEPGDTTTRYWLCKRSDKPSGAVHYLSYPEIPSQISFIPQGFIIRESHGNKVLTTEYRKVYPE